MTIKEIIRIASDDYYTLLINRMNHLSRNLNTMTEYEQKEAKREIKLLSKAIKEGCEND